MTPPEIRWWHVTVDVHGSRYVLDTADPAKIGPWLTDIVNTFQLRTQPKYAPVEMTVRIS